MTPLSVFFSALNIESSDKRILRKDDKARHRGLTGSVQEETLRKLLKRFSPKSRSHKK
jgi:hypothetical protein